MFWGGCTHTWAYVCTRGSVGTLQGAVYSTEQPGTEAWAARAHPCCTLGRARLDSLGAASDAEGPSPAWPFQGERWRILGDLK